MRITDNYIFFWKENPFCNFTKCKIKYVMPDSVKGEEYYFSSSEQMFMWLKAMFFMDIEVANLIYNTDSPEEARKLGRLVKNYDEKLWNEVRITAMRKAVTAKFYQNKELRKQLIDNKYDGKHFVEASPYDRIWGIGCDQDSALKLDNAKNWGRNELGKILDGVRAKCIEIDKLIDELGLVSTNKEYEA